MPTEDDLEQMLLISLDLDANKHDQTETKDNKTEQSKKRSGEKWLER